MEKRLHAVSARSGNGRKDGRAGLPIKRFFTRFRSLAELPAEDLDLLSERIRLALDVNQGSEMTALHEAVRAELHHRESAR
ncbi:hypothetical protein [Pseudarthrobacter sp. DSP2-3-2b1]|uniref:hypothetical protein n=1 Tax=Pseudarthrobacter sp. DSP2-3-2b1 TaxID=2804661 RepID=UPI003CEDCD1D